MNTPTSLQPEPRRSSIHHHAATVSVWAIPAVIVFNILVAVPTSQLDPSVRVTPSMVIGLIIFVILLGGFICGVIGLCGIPKYGKSSLLWKSLIGTLIPTALFLFAYPTVIAALKVTQ